MRRKSEKGENNIWRNNGQKFSKTNEKKKPNHSSKTPRETQTKINTIEQNYV